MRILSHHHCCFFEPLDLEYTPLPAFPAAKLRDSVRSFPNCQTMNDGTTIHNLGDHELMASKTGKSIKINAPIWDDPQEKEVAEVVVPDGAITAEVLLGPVQDSLGERHKSRAKANNSSGRPFGNVREVEITYVHQRLNYIEQSCMEDTVSVTKGWEAKRVYAHCAFVKPSPLSNDGRPYTCDGGRINCESTFLYSRGTYIVNLGQDCSEFELITVL